MPAKYRGPAIHAGLELAGISMRDPVDVGLTLAAHVVVLAATEQLVADHTLHLTTEHMTEGEAEQHADDIADAIRATQEGRAAR